jgi:hypothetical protein
MTDSLSLPVRSNYSYVVFSDLYGAEGETDSLEVITGKESGRYYPKGENGQPLYLLYAMLRVHCMQVSYNLGDPAGLNMPCTRSSPCLGSRV